MVGGVFGNTKLATDPQASVTGRCVLSQQNYMRQEGVGGPYQEQRSAEHLLLVSADVQHQVFTNAESKLLVKGILRWYFKCKR